MSSKKSQKQIIEEQAKLIASLQNKLKKKNIKPKVNRNQLKVEKEWFNPLNIENRKKVLGYDNPFTNRTVQKNTKFGVYQKFVKTQMKAVEGGSFQAFYRLISSQYQFDSNDFSKVDRLIMSNALGRKILIKVTNMNDEVKFLTYTRNSKDEFKDLLADRYYEAQLEDITTSDGINTISYAGIKSFEIKYIPRERGNIMKKKLNKNGKFFKYINTTDIDLTRYQIVKESDNRGILKEHCLIHTLQLHGIDEALINRVKTEWDTSSHFPKNRLDKVSEIIDKTIVLHNLKCNNKKPMIQKYPNKDGPVETIDIVLFEEHYFIYETVNYTTYSIKNYDKVKGLEDFNTIIKCKNEEYEKSSNDNYKTNSFKLIKTLFDNEFFIEDSDILRSIDDFQKYEQPITDIPLTNIDNEQQEYKLAEKIDTPMDIYYADTETDTTNIHKCLMAGIVKDNSDNVQIFLNTKTNPQSAFFQLLEYVHSTSVTKNIVVYFHNLKYDHNIFKQQVFHIDMCEKDGQIYSDTIMYKKKTIVFKDSLKMAPMKLDKFQESFQLDNEYKKKEAIGYSYYKTSNTYQHSEHNKVKLSDYVKHVNKVDRITFYKNAKSELFDYDKINETFDPIKYYMYYLKYDCLILKKGMQKMANLVRELCDMNMYNFLTISSLTNYYMAKNGAFKGVYEVCGNLREYLSKGVYGGRVAVNKKYQKRRITEQISDYDAVSLYPSAIVRMCRELGIPIGKCVRYDKVKGLVNSKYYVVTIKITKINKHQQIPFINYKDPIDKTNTLTNEVVGDNMIQVVDKITLEDYIKFHEIEYEIIDGVVWNNTKTNKVMGELITKLFTKRLEFKKLNNDAMQNTIKLMLNSAYGKTITKKSKTEKKFHNNDDKDEYIINNYNNIHALVPVSSYQYLIEKDKYDGSYNLAHVGILILSYSKRIMNEVMALASDNEIVIYYQDTDSMHMNRNQVEKLEKLYLEKYGKILNGSNTEQFHTDFKLKGAKSEIYSILSIFLGKKCYLDKLESTDKDGNIIQGYHIRMKGITEEGLEHSLITYDSYERLYELLAKDLEVKICLNPGDKKLFQYTQNGCQFRELFYRNVNFISKEDRHSIKLHYN